MGQSIGKISNPTNCHEQNIDIPNEQEFRQYWTKRKKKLLVDEIIKLTETLNKYETEILQLKSSESRSKAEMEQINKKLEEKQDHITRLERKIIKMKKKHEYEAESLAAKFHGKEEELNKNLEATLEKVQEMKEVASKLRKRNYRFRGKLRDEQEKEHFLMESALEAERELLAQKEKNNDLVNEMELFLRKNGVQNQVQILKANIEEKDRFISFLQNFIKVEGVSTLRAQGSGSDKLVQSKSPENPTLPIPSPSSSSSQTMTSDQLLNELDLERLWKTRVKNASLAQPSNSSNNPRRISKPMGHGDFNIIGLI